MTKNNDAFFGFFELYQLACTECINKGYKISEENVYNRFLNGTRIPAEYENFVGRPMEKVSPFMIMYDFHKGLYDNSHPEGSCDEDLVFSPGLSHNDYGDICGKCAKKNTSFIKHGRGIN